VMGLYIQGFDKAKKYTVYTTIKYSLQDEEQEVINPSARR